MPDLIKEGHLFVAVMPLFGATINPGTKQEQIVFLRDDKAKDEWIQKVAIPKKLKYHMSRYKGLGELHEDELYDTMLNPATRVLHQVTMEDASLADECCRKLMGKDSKAKRMFLESGDF